MTTIPVQRECAFRHEGHQLVYDVFGDRGPLVVYLHGLLLDSQLNVGIADALARGGNRVVLLDLLGHGRSDTPKHAAEYRIDRYAEQAVALIDHLGEREAALGGLSLGANVSLFAASRHPSRVRALVLEMPVLERAVPGAALLFSPMTLAAHYGRWPWHCTAALGRHLPRTSFGPLNSVLNAASTEPETIAAVLHGILVGPVAPTQEQRRAITAPTLVLAHRFDFIHPLDDATGLVRQMPNARLVRARSPLELRLRPERLTDEIARFLAELPPPNELTLAEA